MFTVIRVALCLAAAAGAAYAGDLIPTDTRFGPLRVASHKVDASVDNQVALTRVEQVFANDHSAQLEAHYVFPVPKGATVIDFSMTVNGKLVRGELLEKDRARRVYEGTLRQAKDPGLLEHVGANVFRVRVFPILPKSEQKIELTYVERVNYDAGRCRYTYPLRVPGGKGGATADLLEIRWKVASRVPIAEISCPTHRAEIALKSENYGEAAVDQKQADLSKDLEISYRLARPASGMDLVTHRPPGEEGTFLLLITPEARPARIAKDVTFVIDTSGSMEGKRLQQARAALKFCLSKLGPEDRFNLVTFSGEVRALLKEPILATEEVKEQARKFVDGLEALGGTNINDALLRALAHKAGEGRPHLILFLTDGEPTSGETDPRTIVRNVLAANRAGVRIFTFGVGDNLNKALLDDLAEATHAVAETVAESENIEEKVSRLQAKVASPVITDLSIDWGGAEVSAVHPKSPGDLFLGTQLMVTGRYAKSGTFEVSLKGRAGEQAVEIRQRMVFPEANPDSPAIVYLWALRRISALLDEIRRGGENPEVVAQVTALSKRHRIATPYTSFLVLENEAAYDREGIERKGPSYKPPAPLAAAAAPGGLFATHASRSTGKVFVPGLNDHLWKFEFGLGRFLRDGKNKDGSFGPEKVTAGGRTFTRAGTSGLVLLGFANSNYLKDSSYFGPVADDTIKYLTDRQKAGGELDPDVLNHALATLALTETLGAGVWRVRDAAKKAAGHLVSLRKADGSWGDLVTSAIAQLAIESARAAKLDEGGQPFEKAGKAFESRPALKPENAGEVAAWLAVNRLCRGERDEEAAKFLRREPYKNLDPDLLAIFLAGAAHDTHSQEWRDWWMDAVGKASKDGETIDLPQAWPAEARPVATALMVLLDLLGKRTR